MSRNIDKSVGLSNLRNEGPGSYLKVMFRNEIYIDPEGSGVGCNVTDFATMG